MKKIQKCVFITSIGQHTQENLIKEMCPPPLVEKKMAFDPVCLILLSHRKREQLSKVLFPFVRKGSFLHSDFS